MIESNINSEILDWHRVTLIASQEAVSQRINEEVKSSVETVDTDIRNVIARSPSLVISSLEKEISQCYGGVTPYTVDILLQTGLTDDQYLFDTIKDFWEANKDKVEYEEVIGFKKVVFAALYGTARMIERNNDIERLQRNTLGIATRILQESRCINDMGFWDINFMSRYEFWATSFLLNGIVNKIILENKIHQLHKLKAPKIFQEITYNTSRLLQKTRLIIP